MSEFLVHSYHRALRKKPGGLSTSCFSAILIGIRITFCSVNSRLPWSLVSCSAPEGTVVGSAVINPSSLVVSLRGGMPCLVEIEITRCRGNWKIREQPPYRSAFTQGVWTELHTSLQKSWLNFARKEQ